MTAHVESDTPADPVDPVGLDQVVFRPLIAADSEAYRRLRQRVLDLGEGRFFNTSYDKDRQSTSEDQWRERCAETPVRCTIGIFVEGALVGIMGILPYGDPANRTAELESTWIDPQYRRTGVAREAYERVRQWCLEHGYRYAIIEIRADNTRSREIREKQGVTYLFTRRNVAWADGSTADTLFFLQNLLPGAERSRSLDQAIPFLEAALTFLKQEQRDEAAAGRGGCS
jgi:RimJ/RimL family protein N-acetyltransferase